MRALLALAALLTSLVAGSTARAHGTRSVTVEVTEVAQGKAVVRVRAGTPGDSARAVFDAPCHATVAAAEREGDGADAGAGEEVTAVECPGSLAGSRLTVEGLGPILSEAILVVSLTGGERVSRVLMADAPSFVLPARQSGLAVARGYVRLGLAHILTGYDHLLFLLSLVLLLRRPRAVLAAETAFTVSHSLSFSATALGLVHVSAPAAEAAIALSLVLVALDLGRPGIVTPTGEGAALAFVFGLVHGLGFAGGLAEAGLPDHDLALALAGFAAGVELGQMAFLAALLLALHLARRALVRVHFEPVAALLIGGVATSWLIERTLACFWSRG